VDNGQDAEEEKEEGEEEEISESKESPEEEGEEPVMGEMENPSEDVDNGQDAEEEKEEGVEKVSGSNENSEGGDEEAIILYPSCPIGNVDGQVCEEEKDDGEEDFEDNKSPEGENMEPMTLEMESPTGDVDIPVADENAGEEYDGMSNQAMKLEQGFEIEDSEVFPSSEPIEDEKSDQYDEISMHTPGVRPIAELNHPTGDLDTSSTDLISDQAKNLNNPISHQRHRPRHGRRHRRRMAHHNMRETASTQN
ncbi:unnamed protein product, partial [Hymenolepis diminuta]|uniref:ELM2 domain-containing protein n=1 Tax=Hymenolepis diminuta TaxID=6216 RepID=A0A0R3SNS4_HYMDI